MGMRLRYKPNGEEVPAVWLQPVGWNKTVAVWLDKSGKQGMFTEGGGFHPMVVRLLHERTAVLGLDLFGQGEFTDDGKPLTAQPLNASAKDARKSYAGYTFGYNHPLFAKRVHDALTAVACARSKAIGAEKVVLYGLAGSGHWAAAVRAQAGAAVDEARIDTQGFRFAKLTAIDDPDFLPGGAKYFDLPGMLALSAPLPLTLAGEGQELPAVVTKAYEALGDTSSLHKLEGQPGK